MWKAVKLVGLIGFGVVLVAGLRWITQSDQKPLHTWRFFRIDSTTQYLTFPNGLYQFNDLSGQVTINELLEQPKRYDFSEVNSPVSMVEDKSYWLRFSVINTEPNSLTRLIEIRFPHLSNVQCYILENGRTNILYKLIQSDPSNLNKYEHPYIVFPVIFPPHHKCTVYLYMTRKVGEGGIPIRLWSTSAFQQHSSTELLLWGGITGWLLYAICLGFLLFIFHHERLYLLYGMYVFAHLFSLIAYEGWVQYYISYMVDGKWLIRASIFTIFFTNSLFIRDFFHSRMCIPTWIRWSNYSNLFIWAMLTLITFLALFSNYPINIIGKHFFNGAFQLCLIVGSILILAYIYLAWQHESSQLAGKLYALAFSPLALVMIGLSVVRIGVVQYLFFVQIHFYAFAIVFETAVLLFGLAYRFKMYRDERETALREQRNIALHTLYTERNRLARELHDYIGPDLAVLKMQMEVDQERQSSLTKPQISTYLISISRILTDIRQVSHALIPMGLNEGSLVAGLTQFIDGLSALPNNPEINFVHDTEIDLPPFMQQSLFQMTKELLINALKHAHATLIDIELYKHDRTVHLTVGDNGQGYDPAHLSSADGIGLHNLQAMVELLNGQLVIKAKAQQGMVHQIIIPVE